MCLFNDVAFKNPTLTALVFPTGVCNVNGFSSHLVPPPSALSSLVIERRIGVVDLGGSICDHWQQSRPRMTPRSATELTTCTVSF